jgi:hypothetical protein
LSTALHVGCELVLAAGCGLAVFVGWRCEAPWAMLGFALMGAAALFGAFRYAGFESVTDAHRSLSLLSSRFALLLIAVGRARSNSQRLLVLLGCAATMFAPHLAALGINLAALLVIACRAGPGRHAFAIAGSLLFVLAGLVIGAEGEWMSVPRVDLFHLALAAAVLCWSGARLWPLASGPRFAGAT